MAAQSDAADVHMRTTGAFPAAARCREAAHVRWAPGSSPPRGESHSVVHQERTHFPPPLPANYPAEPAGEQDIVISQYAAGGKEAIRAALKQRSQSAPSRREVKVQLLSGEKSSFPEAQPSAVPPADQVEHGTANITAVVSATLAATAPIFKAQSDVEARVSRLSESLRRLQEANRPQNPGPGCQAARSFERVAQLEEQLYVLTQQKLQHLERIQEQQLELQKHLIRSAVDVATAPPPAGRALSAAHTEATLMMDTCGHSERQPSGAGTCADVHQRGHGGRQSSLETPAPRCFIPRPISQEGNCAQEGREHSSRELQRETCLSSGNGRHLEEIPDDPTYPKGATQSTGGQRVAMATLACQPEMSRARAQQHTVFLPMFPSTRALHQPGSASQKYATSALGSTSQEGSDAPWDFSRMRADLQVQPGDAFALEARKPTESSGSVRPTVSTPLPYLHIATPEECPSASQPAVLHKSRPPPSILENAREDFRGVCHRRKVLDENLEAMRRARDQEAFYSLLDSISSTGDITEKIRIKKTVDAWMWLSRKGMENTPSETKCVQEAEAYLKNIYGKEPFKNSQRTQKTSPYLRGTSPFKKSKVQRPSVVERVKGVKVKSAKTQTSPFPGQGLSSVRHTKQQDIFGPTRGGPRDPQKASPSLLEDFLIPMAIPLGKPRVYDMGRQSSCVLAEDQPITTPGSVAQSSPKTAASTACRPNTTMLEVRSAKKGPPQLQVQVLPSVNIDSVSSESPVSSSPPPPPPPSIQTVQQTLVELEPEEEEEVESLFPGTDFLAVADISQEPQATEPLEDIVIQLNGIGERPAPLYHGPVPHSQAPDPPAAVVTSLGAILERESLENQLVEWVEQQVMARMVMELSLQPDRFEPESFSEEQDSSSSTSDAAEAASGENLLLVLAGIPVDSELVRQYVDEALAETVAVFLGQREVQSPVPSAAVRDDAPTQEEPLVCTPVPTPSPRESPSLGAIQPPVATPEASEQECVSPKEAQYTTTAASVVERSLVTTPHTTPATSPPRPGTPSPPHALWSPEPVSQHDEPWAGREHPLEEETQPCGKEELQQQMVMSVAREEESVSLISPSPSTPPEPLLPPSRSPKEETPPPRPTPSTEESSSTLSITETEIPGRHISEGELVMSYGQMAAARGLLEEGLVFPNLSGSLSSSLHGLQDMEYDPPSEGQLPQRQDPVLSLLGKMNQGLISRQEEACTHEALWEMESSSIELSDEQRPQVTAATHGKHTGQFMVDKRISSPGQVSLPPGVRGGRLAGRQHPVSWGHLEGEPAACADVHIPVDPSQCEDEKSTASETSAHSVDRPAPILVRQYQEKPAHTKEGDTDVSVAITALHGTGVLRPSSANQDEGSVSISTVEGDTDSSGSNVF